MDALILTCGTGGGHNSAAEAIRQEFTRRGDRATVLNPYDLGGGKRARQLDWAYISLVQRAPWGFGFIYKLGDAYRHLPWRSPVYHLNKKRAAVLRDYLREHPADVVVTTHTFPAEILTQMKSQGMERPKCIFVATDYTCTPFMEEADCDANVIPARDLTEEFHRKGIPLEKLKPLGIPVRREFVEPVSREEARRALGLEQDKRYLLLSGGSIGAGKLKRTIRFFYERREKDTALIVICGNNEKLYQSLSKTYDPAAVKLIKSTDRMALYIRSCDLYLTKPGGLSSTEGAAMGTPLVHLPPIPGCETCNARFFRSRGMSVTFKGKKREVRQLLDQLEDASLWREMAARQHETVPGDAAAKICDLAKELVGEDQKTV